MKWLFQTLVKDRNWTAHQNKWMLESFGRSGFQKKLYQSLCGQQEKCVIGSSGTVCLLVIFQFIKRIPANSKILPIPPNISNTPIHTKKIITLKSIHIKPTFSITPFHTKKIIILEKDTYKIWKYLYNPFYSNNFLKITILLKSINTNPKYLYNPHSYWKIITLRSILQNLKISRTVFLLKPFSNI